MTFECIDSRPLQAKTPAKVWGYREGCPRRSFATTFEGDKR